MVLKLKPAQSVEMGLVAREMALELAESPFQPEIRASHLPGISNVVADSLSRRWDPRYSSSWRPPSLLSVASEVRVPQRDDLYFRTLFSASSGPAEKLEERIACMCVDYEKAGACMYICMHVCLPCSSCSHNMPSSCNCA